MPFDTSHLVMFREGYDLRAATLRACATAGITPMLSCEGGEMDCVLALVRAGLGAAIVPELVTTADLHTLQITDPPLSRRIGLIHRNDRPLPRAAHVLTTLLPDRSGTNHPMPGAAAGQQPP